MYGYFGPSQLRAMREVLYDLHAILQLHPAKENELYLPLLDSRISAAGAIEMVEEFHASERRSTELVAGGGAMTAFAPIPVDLRTRGSSHELPIGTSSTRPLELSFGPEPSDLASWPGDRALTSTSSLGSFGLRWLLHGRSRLGS